MESEMETAVAKELYERAAELRDAIQQLKKVEQPKNVEKLRDWQTLVSFPLILEDPPRPADVPPPAYFESTVLCSEQISVNLPFP